MTYLEAKNLPCKYETVNVIPRGTLQVASPVLAALLSNFLCSCKQFLHQLSQVCESNATDIQNHK